MKDRTKKIALLGIMTAVALILAYLEAILPPLWSAVPGVKMGLPNLVIIFVLYRFGFKEAVAVSAIRLFTVSLLFGNVMTLAYSAAGAVLSLILMVLLKKIDNFSTVGVSVAGAVSHNLGQILVAVFLFDTVQLGYYMIILAITGSIAGVFIGIGANLLIKRTQSIKM
ncbi:MAG: Gx transporter family protein [Clostridia bacterium]|nr:Gx transporter family protein [Clostridia bacterium]